MYLYLPSFILYILLSFIPVLAANSSNLPGSGYQAFSLSRLAAIYLDQGDTLSLEEAKLKFHRGEFSEQENNDITGGYHANDALWIHLYINWNDLPDDASWLHIIPDIVDEITLFSEEGCGSPNRFSGRTIPFLARDKPIWGYAFHLEHDSHKNCEYYLRLKTSGALRIEINLWKEGNLELFSSRLSAMIAAYIGMMLLMLFISSIRAIFYKSLGDAAYSLHIFGFEMLNMGGVGMIQTWGFSDSIELRMILIQMGGAIASAAFPTLVIKLIEWPEYQRKILCRCTACIIPCFMAFTLWNTFLRTEILVEYGLGFCIIILTTSIVSIFWALINGYNNSKVMTISFTPWFITITYQYIDRITDIGSIDYITVVYILMGAVIFHSTVLWFIVLGRDARLNRAREKLEWEMSALRKQMSDQALFLNMLAHEIRRPAQIIETNALDLSMASVIDTQARQERLSRLRQATRELANLLDTCLSKLRLVCTDYIDVKAIPIHKFISMIVEQSINQSSGHLITFRHLHLPELFHADPTLLSVLIQNLLENAIKYTPGDGSILITATIDKNGELIIEVTDDGPGIPKNEIDKIFDRYYQIAPSTKQGMGLGLYISKRIAELHGGTISCSSTMGEGAKFTVKIIPQKKGKNKIASAQIYI